MSKNHKKQGENSSQQLDVVKKFQFQRLLQMLAFNAPGGFSIRPWLHRLRGADIGKEAWIGLYVYIDGAFPEAIHIGDRSIIGMRSSLFAHVVDQFTGPVTIEEDVFIGPHCVILPNLTIGKGSVIRAGSVVSTNVPPHTLWGEASSGPIAKITVPLKAGKARYSPGENYNQFLRGLRPIRKNKPIVDNSDKK